MTGTVAAASALCWIIQRSWKSRELGKIKEVNESFSILDRLDKRLIHGKINQYDFNSQVEEGEI